MPDEPQEDLVPMKTSGLTKTIKAGEGGFALQTVEDAVNFARWNWESGLLPEHIRDTKQAFAIMARGAELGLKPHASWRWLYMTKAGKIAMETKGMLAVCQAQSFFEGYKEFIQNEAGDPKGWVAVAEARRKGREPQVKEFSFADAERAGLLQKKRSRKSGDYIDGPYQLYLKDMLLARARQRALELQFGDVLGGMVSREVAQEVEDREEENGTLKRREPPKVRVVDPLMAAAQGAKPEKGEEPVAPIEAEVVVEEPEEEAPGVKPWECPGCGQLQAQGPCSACGLNDGDEPPPPPKAKAKKYEPGDVMPSGKIVEEVDEKGRPTVVKTPPAHAENPFEKGKRRVQEMREKAAKEAEQQTLPEE